LQDRAGTGIQSRRHLVPIYSAIHNRQRRENGALLLILIVDRAVTG
jgi:hypothetical protein